MLLYAVPVGQSSLIEALMVCETDADTTFDIAHVPNLESVGDSAKQYLYKGQAATLADTFIVSGIQMKT